MAIYHINHIYIYIHTPISTDIYTFCKSTFGLLLFSYFSIFTISFAFATTIPLLLLAVQKGYRFLLHHLTTDRADRTDHHRVWLSVAAPSCHLLFPASSQAITVTMTGQTKYKIKPAANKLKCDTEKYYI